MTHCTPATPLVTAPTAIKVAHADMPYCPIQLPNPKIFGIAQWVSALVVYISIPRKK